MIRRSKLILTVAVVAILGAQASGRTPISEDRVVSALNGFHLPVQKSQVQLLSAVSSKTPMASLQLVGVERWNERDALVKFRCARSGECLPFFVALHWPTTQDRDLALAGSRTNGMVRANIRREMLVRAGQKATMIVPNSKFHAATPIICLEAGSQGQKVRVATMDHKKIALAEVIDNGVLRGSF